MIELVIKALAALTVIGTIVIFILRKWYGPKAEKKQLLKKIRDLQDEMLMYPVGSDEHNRLRAKWLRLNRQYSDSAWR